MYHGTHESQMMVLMHIISKSLKVFIFLSTGLHNKIGQMMQELDDRCIILGNAYKGLTQRHMLDVCGKKRIYPS